MDEGQALLASPGCSIVLPWVVQSVPFLGLPLSQRHSFSVHAVLKFVMWKPVSQ